MIFLSFAKPHRSIQTLPPVSLPDFAVITGINGSGKSHLLEAISQGAVKVAGVSTPPQEQQIRFFDWTNLVPQPTAPADPIQLRRERAGYIENLASQFKRFRTDFLDPLAQWNLSHLPLADLDRVLTMQEAEYQELWQAAHPGQSDSRWSLFAQQRNSLAERCHNLLRSNPPLHNVLREQAKTLGVDVSGLSIEQMDAVIPLTWNPTDIFQQSFSQIFAQWYRAWDENRYNAFANTQYGEHNVVLTDAEFEQRFGEPPWNFVNKLLDEAHLQFEINNPQGRADTPFEARLRDKITDATVSFQDLSSGEKILMSFALCLYNASDTTRYVNYPKLLLFDEVDAPLHPSMTKDLVRVINRILVQDKGVKVILTTHSPATVAFSPDGHLFRLEKHPRQLVLSSREQAIQTLTSGYISVTDNTRFVISEAKQDRLFYTAIVRKLVERGKLGTPPNLVFVQASDKKDRTGGGRNQVKDWSTKLPQAGLTQILGLIDRDTNNIGSTTIKVLPRYSFENYLLDPLLIYAVLMSHGVHLSTYDAGIKDANFYELRNLSEGELQKIAEAVSATVETHSGQVRLVTGTFSVSYVGDKTLTMPVWLRDFSGHELEAAVRHAFKMAVGGGGFIITHNDCEDLIDMLTERLPDFIPTDLVEVLRELQTV